MKTSTRQNLILAMSVVLLIAGLVACSTTQQTTTYNALQTVELTADTGYSNYVNLVITGKVSTNSLPAVSKAYNDLHGAIALAASLDQSGTNVAVPTNITTELTYLVNLIATAVSTNH